MIPTGEAVKIFLWVRAASVGAQLLLYGSLRLYGQVLLLIGGGN